MRYFLLVFRWKHETLRRIAIFHKQFPFCKSKTAVFFPPARICLIACTVCRQRNLFPIKQLVCQLIKEQLCNAEMPILRMDSQKVYAACVGRKSHHANSHIVIPQYQSLFIRNILMQVCGVIFLIQTWIAVNRKAYQFHPVIRIFGRGKFNIVFCQIHFYKLLLQINFKL